jgi:adenosine deaminase
MTEARGIVQADLFDTAPPAVVVTSSLADSPKIDLHRHLLGCLTPQNVWDLAVAHGLQLPLETIDKLREFIVIETPVAGLREFFRPWSLLSRLLVSPAILESIFYLALKQAHEDRVVYCELRATWGMTGREPFTVSDFLQAAGAGIGRAEAEFGIRGRLVLGVTRHLFARHAPQTRRQLWSSILNCAALHRESLVVGFDLSGIEDGYAAEMFEPEFLSAKAEGFPITIHCGETTSSIEVKSVVERLQPTRIGHGLSAIDDGHLVRFLARNQIAVEACPSSNWLTRTVQNLAEHPLRVLHDNGVPVTLNTDNPAICATSLSREYAIAHQLMGLSQDALKALTTNSLRFMFASSALRRQVASDWFRDFSAGA